MPKNLLGKSVSISIFILFVFPTFLLGIQPTSSYHQIAEFDRDDIQSTCTQEEIDSNSLVLAFHFQRIENRYFLWQIPTTPTPEYGYPVLFLFHGAAQYPFSWFIELNAWGKEQTTFTQLALEKGFFIIAPASQRPINPGPRAWDAFTKNLTESSDLQFLDEMLCWLGTINIPINWNAIFCAGFSSGAFMVSRIANVFGERFAGVIVHSGAHADAISLTNRGPVFNCTAPYEFPGTHSPTLIIHGGSDKFVPAECGLHYYDELKRNGFDVTLLFDAMGGHIWLSNFNDEILNWTTQHI